MINLLPQKDKDVLYNNQVRKLIIVLGIVFLIGTVCLFLILLSVKIYISGQTSLQKIELEGILKTAQSPQSLNLQTLISKYNNDLMQTSLFYENQVYASQVLEIIFGVSKPESLYFTGVSLNTVQKDKDSGEVNDNVEVVVSGVSDTRDNLTLFKKNIEEEKRIKSVYFPPESWINAKNIRFIVTLEIPKKEVGNNNITNE